MRPRHKPGCTAFFILLLRAVPASGCKPAPDGGPSRPVGSLSAVSVSGCPRSPTVFGCGLPLAGCSPAALFRLRPRLAPPSSGFAGSSRFCCCTRPKDLMKKITLISFLPCRFRLCFVPAAGAQPRHHPAQQVTWAKVPSVCLPSCSTRPTSTGRTRPTSRRGCSVPRTDSSRLLCRGLRRRHARARTARVGDGAPKATVPSTSPAQRSRSRPRCRRVVLRTQSLA